MGVSPTFSAAGLSEGNFVPVALQVTDSGGSVSLVSPATIDVVAAPSGETHLGDTDVALRDAHPKNGRSRTTSVSLQIDSTSITSIGTLDLDISIDGGVTNIGDLSAVLIGRWL